MGISEIASTILPALVSASKSRVAFATEVASVTPLKRSLWPLQYASTLAGQSIAAWSWVLQTPLPDGFVASVNTVSPMSETSEPETANLQSSVKR